jgi:hypothetical protein
MTPIRPDRLRLALQRLEDAATYEHERLALAGSEEHRRRLRPEVTRRLGGIRRTLARLRGERPPRGARRTRRPSVAWMEAWMSEGVAEATDGCRVEPDGTCEHGKPSWLLTLGLI